MNIEYGGTPTIVKKGTFAAVLGDDWDRVLSMD